MGERRWVGASGLAVFCLRWIVHHDDKFAGQVLTYGRYKVDLGSLDVAIENLIFSRLSM